MKLPFNKWSQKRIMQGRKFCTSRTKKYDDLRVFAIIKMPLWIVSVYLWELEGADSPHHFEKIWTAIHPKQGWTPNLEVYVHFGDFR